VVFQGVIKTVNQLVGKGLGWLKIINKSQQVVCFSEKKWISIRHFFDLINRRYIE